MKKRLIKKKKMLLFVFIYFFISVFIRGYLSDFPKIISIYPDELRYLELARSILNGNGITIHNKPTDFQKILYSIVIMPAFLFKNPDVQVRAIGWINSIVMSSAVFPTYGLARRILKKDFFVHVVLIALITLPTMVSTMYFMSEVLFLPISLCTVYIVYIVIHEDIFKVRVLKNICLGFVFYGAYLNKEIALYYLLAYFIVRIWHMLLHHEDRIRECICLGSMIVSFCMCFIAMKLIFFYGMGNSYNQMGLEAILSIPKIIYLIYGVIYDLMFAVLAMGVFTVLIPIASITKGQDHKQSQFLCFILFALLIGCVTIAYTITVREDFPNRSPRQHLRYLEPLFIPFLIGTLSVLQNVKDEKIIVKKTGILVFLYCFVFINIIYNIGVGPCVDHSTLKYFEYLVSFLKPHALMELGLDWQMFLLRELFVAVCLLVFWLFYKKIRCFLIVILLGLFGLNLVNNMLGYRAAVPVYTITDETRSEIAKIDKVLESMQGNILLVTEYNGDDGSRLFDTYVDNKYLYRTSFQSLETRGLLEDGVVNLESEYTSDVLVVNSQLRQVHWIIAFKNISFPKGSVQEVEGFPMTDYRLYRNMEIDKVYIETMS